MYVFKLNDIKITFANISEIIDLIKTFLSTEKNPCQIITLNSLIYLQSKICYLSKKALREAKLVLCDSFGVALCCSIFSGRFLKHQPGIELIEHICLLAKQNRYKIYLFGAKEEVVSVAAEKLKKKFSVDIVGYHHGYIFLGGEDLSEEIIEDINKRNVDILLVGLPTELQEGWIKEHIDKLNCKIVMGIGGSFDIISGRLKRAPKLFRVLGLEWYFRMLQEPWRIKRILKLPLALAILFFDCLENFMLGRQKILNE